MEIIKSSLVSSKSYVGIVVARVNYFINKQLLDGAIDVLERVGQINSRNITVVWVPGAYELSLIVKILTDIKKYDAIIALGTIISGETEHYKYIANTCSAELIKISMKSSVPITSGILITNNINQAIERSGTKHGNKGSDAALAALEMINIIHNIKNI